MSVKGKSMSELYSLMARRVMSSVYSQQRRITRRFSSAFLVNHHECQTVDISNDSYERRALQRQRLSTPFHFPVAGSLIVSALLCFSSCFSGIFPRRASEARSTARTPSLLQI